jgi:uracil-DNA glycosylase family 4
MRWTERQRAMLREMGIHLWAPEAAPTLPTTSADAGVGVATAVRGSAGAGAVVAPAVPTRAAADAAAALRLRVAEPTATTARLPGLAPADWLVVAEVLDDGDPQQQQLLENMLRAIGVGLVAPDRECRAVFSPVGGTANAATRASDQAALQAAIATVAPRCILAFGRAGAAALLGDDAPLGGLRGRVHAHAGVPVVVTFSLAFLLRHPAEKAKAWADLCLAVGSLAAAAAA